MPNEEAEINWRIKRISVDDVKSYPAKTHVFVFEWEDETGTSGYQWSPTAYDLISQINMLAPVTITRVYGVLISDILPHTIGEQVRHVYEVYERDTK